MKQEHFIEVINITIIIIIIIIIVIIVIIVIIITIVFHGHPRTPWTVKYHPIDSNIVASGCLGSEVRVWNIQKNFCMNVIRYDNSVISLAFHPSGQFISVASGLLVYFWDWKEGMAVVHGGYPLGRCPYAESRGFNMNGQPRRIISHSRNIRAVMFHPDGYVFIAAPDPPRVPSATFTPCRLYAFDFDLIFDVSMPPHIELQNLPTVVPQIHLYSDGGFDISQDGQHLFTCAMLHVPPVPSMKSYVKSNCVSFSPLSHRERSVADDEHDNAADGILEFIQEGRRPLSRKEPDHRPNSRVDILPRNQLISPPHDIGLGGMFDNVTTPRAFDNANQPPPIPTFAQRSRVQFDDVMSNDPDSNNMIQFPHLIDPSGYDDIEMINDNNNNGNDDNDNDNDEDDEQLQPIFADKKSLYEVPEGWKLEVHLCLFKLTFQEDGQINKANLIRYRPLTSALMKAVTSAKLSPTGRYALIGYGVRNRGVVEDHPHSLVACEVIDIMDRNIKTVSIMADTEDEVNIAQFHPTPGSGILYGTKRGKVRVFQRWQN